MKSRTKRQANADAIDRQLFVILGHAKGAALVGTPAEKARWRRIATHLRGARFDLREEMHPEDQATND